MPGRAGPLGNFDLDESPDAPPVSEQIIAALMANAGKVIDLFRSWDDNGDGIVTRAEFHKAMKQLGLQVPKDAIDTIFSRWDKDGGGELSLPEMTKILRMAATTQKGLDRLRKVLTRRGLKLSALFREWDTNGDGEIDRDEFRKALKYLGLDFPKDQVDACFDSFDRDGSGTISHREFNRILRRDLKAEEEAKRKREEAERIAREKADRVVPVDVADLRGHIKQRIREPRDEPQPVAPVIDPGTPNYKEVHKMQSVLTAKDKASNRERLHLLLRLRGTHLEPPVPVNMERRSSLFAESRSLDTLREDVTRHSRRPRELKPLQTGLPRHIDVLSKHRPRSHLPARKDFHVLLKPLPPKLSRPHLEALKMTTTERELRARGLASSKSVPAFGHNRTVVDFTDPAWHGKGPHDPMKALAGALTEGRILTAEEMGQLKKLGDANLMNEVTEGRMLTGAELARLKDKGDEDLMEAVTEGRILAGEELERLKEKADEDIMAAVETGRILSDDETKRLKTSAAEDVVRGVEEGRILSEEELTVLRDHGGEVAAS